MNRTRALIGLTLVTLCSRHVWRSTGVCEVNAAQVSISFCGKISGAETAARGGEAQRPGRCRV